MCNCDVEEAGAKFGIDCDMNEDEIEEIDKSCAERFLS